MEEVKAGLVNTQSELILPYETWYDIFLLCDIKGIASLLLSCKHLHLQVCNLMSDNILWKNLFMRDFMKYYTLPSIDIYPKDVQEFFNTDDLFSRDRTLFDLRLDPYWKLLYMENYVAGVSSPISYFSITGGNGSVKIRENAVNIKCGDISIESGNIMAHTWFRRYKYMNKSVIYWRNGDKRYISEDNKGIIGHCIDSTHNCTCVTKFRRNDDQFIPYGITVYYYNNGDILVMKWGNGIPLGVISFTFSVECKDKKFAGKQILGGRWIIKKYFVKGIGEIYLYWPARKTPNRKLFREYVTSRYIGWNKLACEFMIHLYSIGY